MPWMIVLLGVDGFHPLDPWTEVMLCSAGFTSKATIRPLTYQTLEKSQ